MAGKLRAHAWPWFLLAAVVLIVGYVVHGGVLQSVVRAAAVFMFLAACIRLVGLMVRDNPTSAEMVTRLHRALGPPAGESVLTDEQAAGPVPSGCSVGMGK